MTSRPGIGVSLLLSYLAFVSLALPDGLMGVAWPSISADLGVPLDAVGLLLVAGTVGYVTSSVMAGFTLVRLGVGRLLAVSTAAVAAALAGYAASPAFALLVGLSLLVGAGSGAIDSGLNAYAAAAFGPRHMNWMHAFFGVGMAIGPLVMTAVLAAGASWRWGYALVGGLQAALTTTFLLTSRRWPRHRPPPEDATAPAVRVPVRATLAIPAVWSGAAAFAVYTAVEVAAGLWAFVLLTSGREVDETVAGICVSAYWVSLFVGRVVQGVVAERIGSHRVLLGSLVGMVGGALLVAVPGSGATAVTGLLVIGFAAAPVFPLLTHTTAGRVGEEHTDRTVGIQMGATGLGGALLPALVGILLSRGDVELLGPALVVLALVLLALYLVSPRGERPAASGSDEISSPDLSYPAPPLRGTDMEAVTGGPVHETEHRDVQHHPARTDRTDRTDDPHHPHQQP